MTPKGIERLAATIQNQHALLLLLDGFPYVEALSRKPADFATSLNLWKRKTLPSLVRSQARLFHLSPDGSIVEMPIPSPTL